MTFSLLVLISSIIGAAFVTYLITNQVISKDYTQIKKDFKALEKKQVKHKSTVQKLEKSQLRWKTKAEELEQGQQASLKELQEKYDQLHTQFSIITSEKNSASNELQRTQDQLIGLENKIEFHKEEVRNWSEKYQKDLHDSKNWKSIKDKLEKEIGNLRHAVSTGQHTTEKLNAKLKNQTSEINELAKIKKQLRLLDTEKNKIDKERAYWEKMHYDTHHELANLKKAFDHATVENTELKDTLKGESIVKQGMLDSIKEFKSKFVNVNQQYHKLLEEIGRN